VEFDDAVAVDVHLLHRAPHLPHAAATVAADCDPRLPHAPRLRRGAAREGEAVVGGGLSQPPLKRRVGFHDHQWGTEEY
jgi:hypothetical protein